MPEPTDIDLAMEVFARGFAFTRSFTHPYLVERYRGMWVMRDADRKNARGYRREEWVAHRLPAAQVDSAVRKQTRGRFAICTIRTPDEPPEPIRADYKSLGYRLATTEAFMLHRMTRIPKLPDPLPVHRITNADLAARYGKATKHRPMPPECFAPESPHQVYLALDGETPVGWVTSIAIGDASWVANMYVRPTHRRRGIGKSLLAHMLRDARARGAQRSVLLASHTGALLYPIVGYETIGELLLFNPKR